MREQQHRALFHVRREHVFVEFLLHHVRGQHGDQIGILHRLGGGFDGEAIGLCLDLGRTARAQPDDDIETGFTQIQRVRAALAAVADNSDLDLGQVVGAHGEGPLEARKKRADGQRRVGPSGEEGAPAWPRPHANAPAVGAVGVGWLEVGWRVMVEGNSEGEDGNRRVLKRKNPHLVGCGF